MMLSPSRPVTRTTTTTAFVAQSLTCGVLLLLLLLPTTTLGWTTGLKTTRTTRWELQSLHSSRSPVAALRARGPADAPEQGPHHHDDRRTFLARAASTAAASVASASILGPSLVFPQPAYAVGGMNKVNDKLRGFGLPTYSSVPDGFTPLCEIYGKGKNRFPILVTFAHPLTWIVTTPSNDANGEDGTVQAGEYAKGDTATFFVNEEPGHVDDIQSAPKDLVERTLIKAISQKGDNMYQNFKVLKVEPVTYDSGEKYVKVDFKYQLLTGAGFEVDRRGVASLTSQGPAVEALWAASTTQRYKKTETDLRNIVASFRCYASGINLSDELASYD